MLLGSNNEKICLESMIGWEFTTLAPPSEIPHCIVSHSWIIFWKSWVKCWILIWTQAGEMASSLNFRFLLCDRVALPCSPTCCFMGSRLKHGNHSEGCVMLKWNCAHSDPELQAKCAVAGFFLDTKDFHMPQKFLKCDFPLSASIVLQEAGSTEGSDRGASFWKCNWRISLFSCVAMWD